jgi:hypothetical protein
MKDRKLNAKLKRLIHLYRDFRKSDPDTWLSDCGSQDSLDRAIKMAALARNNANKKHPHQYRIPNNKLNNLAVCILSKKKDLKRAKKFDQILSIVESCRKKGIGELVCYDTAHRIGVYLNIYPDKIYLHAGTRIGACNLLERNISDSSIEKEELPSLLQESELSISELEDFLCIYKSNFHK